MQCAIKEEPPLDIYFKDFEEPSKPGPSLLYQKRPLSPGLDPALRLPDVTNSSIDAMNRLLQAWGLEVLSTRFAEHLIDLTVLDYILDVDIVDLCRDLPIRYRLVLRHNLQNGYHKHASIPDQSDKRPNTDVTNQPTESYAIYSGTTMENDTHPSNFGSVHETSSANNDSYSGAEAEKEDALTSRSIEDFNEEELRMSDSDSDCQMDVEATEDATTDRLIPEKSKALYESAYRKFDEWRTKNQFQSVDEKCMFAYFSQEMASQKPSTKWSHFSMLKGTISMNMGVNIGSYSNLVSFLKQKSDGYSPKKSKIFTKEQIFQFLKEANDVLYLGMKVVLIVGVYGACRREEILKLTLKDIEDMGNCVKITIPNSKTKVLRQFIITRGKAPGVDMLQLFRSYAQLRPPGVPHSRFFVGYRAGKCAKQAIGINSIAAMPKKIAEFLKLPLPQEYTGHCFRRSSENLLSDSERPYLIDMSVLKRQERFQHKMSFSSNYDSSQL